MKTLVRPEAQMNEESSDSFLSSQGNDSYLVMLSSRVSSKQTSKFVSKRKPSSGGTAIVPDATASPATIGTRGDELSLANRMFAKKSQFGLADVTNHQPRNRFQRHSVSDEKDTKQDTFVRSRLHEKQSQGQQLMPPPKEGMANIMLLQRQNRMCESRGAYSRKKTPPYNPDGYHFTNLSDGTPVYSSSPFYSRSIGDDEESKKYIDDDEEEGEMKNIPPLVQSGALSPSQRSFRKRDGNLQGILSVDKSSNIPIAESSCVTHSGVVGEDKITTKESFGDRYYDRSCDDENDNSGKKRKNISPAPNEDSRCGDDGLKEKEDAGESMLNTTNTNEPLFKDIIGHQSVKLRLDEVLLPLALPTNLSRSILTGVRSLAASIFMYGPPGCGKTQLAKAVAGEARAAFLSIGPSDILSKYVGESEEAVRSVFAEAVRLAKNNTGGNRCTVLFFDEIDALGQSRGTVGSNSKGGKASSTTQGGGSGSGDNSSRRVLAELLIQLTKVNNSNGTFDSTLLSEREKDSIEEENENGELNLKSIEEIDDSGDSISSGDTLVEGKDECDALECKSTNLDIRGVRIIVVAATNRPEDCDSALIRRFAVQVKVGLPNAKDRRKMLKRSMRDIDHTITKKQFCDISLITDGWSGSDLQSLAREAAMAPVRECIRRAAQLKRRRYVFKSHRGKKKRHRMGDEMMGCISDDSGTGDDDDSLEGSKKSLLEEFRTLRPVSIGDYKNALAFCFSRMYSNLHDSPLAEFGWIEDGMGNRNKNCNGGLNEHYDSSSDEEDDEDD